MVLQLEGITFTKSEVCRNFRPQQRPLKNQVNSCNPSYQKMKQMNIIYSWIKFTTKFRATGTNNLGFQQRFPQLKCLSISEILRFHQCSRGWYTSLQVAPYRQVTPRKCLVTQDSIRKIKRTLRCPKALNQTPIKETYRLSQVKLHNLEEQELLQTYSFQVYHRRSTKDQISK